jgi:hypothetical protein
MKSIEQLSSFHSLLFNQKSTRPAAAKPVWYFFISIPFGGERLNYTQNLGIMGKEKPKCRR